MKAADASNQYTLVVDGTHWGPRAAPMTAAAAVIKSDADDFEAKVRMSLPRDMTNNESDFCALILGLAAAQQLGVRKLVAQTDNDIVVLACMWGMSVKEPHLYVYRHFAVELFGCFESFELQQVDKKEIEGAKALARTVG
uniref:RNase H type-1 domain-containing protein n=1 Tax=Chlamydomonas leiostraca TaxID=1034604 RepID=A0A7S0X0S1_9CHLO